MLPGKTNTVHFFVFCFSCREKIIYGKIQQQLDNLYLLLGNKILTFLRQTSKKLELHSIFLSNKSFFNPLNRILHISIWRFFIIKLSCKYLEHYAWKLAFISLSIYKRGRIHNLITSACCCFKWTIFYTFPILFELKQLCSCLFQICLIYSLPVSEMKYTLSKRTPNQLVVINYQIVSPFTFGVWKLSYFKALFL